jgi:hypothetical protein
MCYSNTNSGAVTFVVDDSGDINAMVQGSVSQTDTGVNTETDCKPGVWDLGTGSAELWYWDSDVKKATVNMTTLIAGSPTSYSVNPTEFTVDKGSCHPVSSTEMVFVYRTSIGGASVAYYNGSAWKYWGRRFLSPTRTMDDGYWTVYSAAVKLSNYLYVYITDMETGQVRGVTYDITKDTWSDTFLAIPAAESRFCIGNAKVVNGFIHMSGQFHRTGDLAEAQKWSLIVRSMTGKNFSWDRHTGLSTLGYQFQFDVDGTGDMLYASDRNSVGTSNLSHYFSASPGTQITLEPPNDILAFTASTHSAASLTLRAADEELIDSAIVVKGNRVKVEVGYHSAGGGGAMEYVAYNIYIIDSVTENFADGKRGLTLSLTAEGVWKTNQIAFPFYAEIISKSTSIDDCDERDKSYEAPSSASTTDDLVIDFWPNEAYANASDSIAGHACSTANGVGCDLQTGRYDMNSDTWGWLRGAYKWGFQTQELHKKLGMDDNPELVDTDLTVRFFGWCSTSTTARENDTYQLRILTEDDEGNQAETVGNLDPSSENRFERKYPSAGVAGSYPVTFNFSGQTVGHKLVRVRIVVENTENGNGGYNYSEFCPERLEITNLKYEIPGLNPSLSWKQTKPSSYGTTDADLLEVPGMGIPYVRFLNKPYSAFNFTMATEFEHEAGATPSTSGTVAWGSVGMAADGSNFIAARLNVGNNRTELMSYRNGDGTVLDYAATGGADAEKIILEHKDGEFFVRVAWPSTPDTWEQPIITYQWDEVADGAISTSETEQMHVGCYGLIDTPKFRTPGFNASDGEGVGMIQQTDMTAIDSFPSSGKLMLDGIIYSYTAKTPGLLGFGPYQLRNSYDYGTYSSGGVKYTGLACEIAFFWGHDLSPTYYSDYLFSGDNGHSWKVSKTLWEVVHSTRGVPNPLNHRSRWYGEQFNDNWFGTDNRIYVGPGLLNISADESLEQSYFHSHGTWCFMAATNKLWIKSMMGTSTDTSSNVEDMIGYLCEAVSVDAEFPGNWTDADVDLTTSPTEIASTETLMPGGYSVRFRTASIGSGNYVELYAGNMVIGEEDSTESIGIRLMNSGGKIKLGAVPKSSIADPQYYICDSSWSPTEVHDWRIFAHEEFVSIYADETWIVTFAWHEDLIHWPKIDPVQLYMRTGGTGITVYFVDVSELFDWREAIYFESELSVQSAISSVIQERPIEVIPKSDGGLWFTYHLVRDTATYTNAISKVLVRSHNYTESINMDSGSDAIVHYRDIAFASNQDYADGDGFFTKVLMLSGLDTGAKAAAQLLLEKANENQYRHTMNIRPDIRLEPGDKIDMSYLITGTGTSVNHVIIINDLGLRIAEGTHEMSITGRKDV